MSVLLMDLGNVVINTNFHRVFASWAAAAGIDKQVFYDHWSADEAYEQHEVGALEFDEYCQTLAVRIGVELPAEAWRSGWNALFEGVYPGVIRRLRTLRDQVDVYAFSNTNNTHADCFQALYGDDLTVFRHVYVSSAIGLRKPDVPAYHFVANDIGVAPSGITFIDDHPDNIAGANAAGLVTIHARGDEQVSAALDRFAAEL